jgi:phosphoglycerol geranylgeranyltransferase
MKDILKKKNQIALLIDPEKIDDFKKLKSMLISCEDSNIDLIFVGGSTCDKLKFQETLIYIKKNSSIPVIIFPGSPNQLSGEADAILFLSLISGRNPYYLIESQIEAAPQIKKMNLEVISTSYLLIDGGTKTTVERVSKTIPLNASNSELIYNTTLAGNFIGHQAIYLDTGSGANNTVPAEIVELISTLNSIIIVGGGIRKIDQIKKFHDSGANITVVGNHVEENPNFLLEIASYKKSKLND